MLIGCKTIYAEKSMYNCFSDVARAFSIALFVINISADFLCNSEYNYRGNIFPT
jgi:hypothetical protein